MPSDYPQGAQEHGEPAGCPRFDPAPAPALALAPAGCGFPRSFDASIPQKWGSQPVERAADGTPRQRGLPARNLTPTTGTTGTPLPIITIRTPASSSRPRQSLQSTTPSYTIPSSPPTQPATRVTLVSVMPVVRLYRLHEYCGLWQEDGLSGSDRIDRLR